MVFCALLCYWGPCLSCRLPRCKGTTLHIMTMQWHHDLRSCALLCLLVPVLQVASMQRDSATYVDEPEDAEDFAAWRSSSFSMSSAQPEIDKILSGRLGSVSGLWWVPINAC
jgi:hypothetical protein